MSTLLCEKPLQIEDFWAIFLPNISEVTLKGINEDDMDEDEDDMDHEKDNMDEDKDDMDEDEMDEDEHNMN